MHETRFFASTHLDFICGFPRRHQKTASKDLGWAKIPARHVQGRRSSHPGEVNVGGTVEPQEQNTVNCFQPFMFGGFLSSRFETSERVRSCRRETEIMERNETPKEDEDTWHLGLDNIPHSPPSPTHLLRHLARIPRCAMKLTTPSSLRLDLCPFS